MVQVYIFTKKPKTEHSITGEHSSHLPSLPCQYHVPPLSGIPMVVQFVPKTNTKLVTKKEVEKKHTWARDVRLEPVMIILIILHLLLITGVHCCHSRFVPVPVV